MSQKRTHSLIESLTNTAVGFVGSMILWQLFVAPAFGFEVTLTSNFIITLIFTVWSIIRGYIMRRIFNRLT